MYENRIAGLNYQRDGIASWAHGYTAIGRCDAIVIRRFKQGDLAARGESFHAGINGDGAPLLGARSIAPNSYWLPWFQGYFSVRHMLADSCLKQRYRLVP